MTLNEETTRLVEQMGASAQQMAEKVQNVSGTGSDDDELVTATCGPGNRLTNIEFDPRSRRLDTHELKEKVITAVQRAGEAAQKQLTDVIGDFSAGFGGMHGSDMGNLQRSMTEAQAKIAEQQQKLEAMYSDLKSRS
ncbi:MAG TPA: YbaB/EbfC family nucleoid-associated protein [Jatrophihabitantaceae bacterium]|jgi:DNA-binding protein YbaB|nr:YbaB/EbfC family nucleoid-associated protein [Jatrophihabitantaceae bacterium]